MARKRKKPVATQLRDLDVARNTTGIRFPGPAERQARRATRGLDALLGFRPTKPLRPLFEKTPRQVRLVRERVATTAALEQSKGGPLSARGRLVARERLSSVLREAICADRKARRESMFARGGAGKGKRNILRKPRRPAVLVRC